MGERKIRELNKNLVEFWTKLLKLRKKQTKEKYEQDCYDQSLEFDQYDVTCGSLCGHFDEFNRCCWLSWWNKEEGDYCDYDLVTVDGEVYSPKELEELHDSILTVGEEVKSG